VRTGGGVGRGGGYSWWGGFLARGVAEVRTGSSGRRSYGGDGGGVSEEPRDSRRQGSEACPLQWRTAQSDRRADPWMKSSSDIGFEPQLAPVFAHTKLALGQDFDDGHPSLSASKCGTSSSCDTWEPRSIWTGEHLEHYWTRKPIPSEFPRTRRVGSGFHLADRSVQTHICRSRPDKLSYGRTG